MPGPSSEPEEERIARLVHDLRTPLTVVGGFADLLEKKGEELEPGQRADYLRRVADAAREMRRILDEEQAERRGT